MKAARDLHKSVVLELDRRRGLDNPPPPSSVTPFDQLDELFAGRSMFLTKNQSPASSEKGVYCRSAPIYLYSSIFQTEPKYTNWNGDYKG